MTLASPSLPHWSVYAGRYREEWDTVAAFTDMCAEVGMQVDSVQLDEGPDLPDDFFLYTITFADPLAPKAVATIPDTEGCGVSDGEEAPAYTFGL